MVRNSAKGTPFYWLQPPEKNLKRSSILCSYDVLNILTGYASTFTYPPDKLLLRHQVRLSGIKFLEESIAPVAVFMEKEEEVLAGERMRSMASPQIKVDQLQEIILLFMHQAIIPPI